MKKLTAMLLVFVMLFALSATAMADDAPEQGENTSLQTLSFMTAWKGILKNELDGDFVKVGPLEMDVWIPEQFTAQSDMPDDTYLLYADSSSNATLQIHHVGLDGATSLEEVEKNVIDLGGISDGIVWVNGLNALVYDNKSADTLNAVILITDDNSGVEFVFGGVSDDEVRSLASIILSTVQRHTLDIEDVAEMIDADLNNTWGECRHVTYGNNEIDINMWDANVNAENISKVDNWDAFKQDKLDYYNLYTDVLARFHMDDIKVVLCVTDPDEQTAFLTIENGEFTTDYSAK